MRGETESNIHFNCDTLQLFSNARNSNKCFSCRTQKLIGVDQTDSDERKVTDLDEGPQLSGLLQLSTPFRGELFQLFQAGRDVVDTVTDDLRVTWLVACETAQ